MSNKPFCRDCADHDGICPGSGKPCDPEQVVRKVAYPMGPIETLVKLWAWGGVRLMTHRPTGPALAGRRFRVSEERTGYGIPNSYADTPVAAEAAARAVLEQKRDQLPRVLGALPVLNAPCRHEYLDMDGVCKECGLGGAPARL